jgi:hypothetical protein
MERWEIIERRVLIAVGIALVAFGAWAVVRMPMGIVVAQLLLPVIFWVFWQAFHEDKLGTDAPVSGTERVMYGTYLWARRVLLGGIALAFGAASVWALLKGMDFAMAILAAVLSGMAGWVALFGAGRDKSLSDDLAVHRARRKRYR